MNKASAISLIALSFLLFGAFVLIQNFYPNRSYKVLEVLEGDKFYIDFNGDNKKSPDELVHLRGVNCFPLYPSKKAEEYARRYGLTLNEAIGLGHLAKDFSKAKLENKEVVLIAPLSPYNPAYYYRFAKIRLKDKALGGEAGNANYANNYDFGALLLQEGLAFAYEGATFNPYKSFENLQKLKKLAQKNSTKINPAKASKNNQKPEAHPSKKLAAYTVSPYKKFPIQGNQGVTVFFTNPNTFNKPSFSCKTPACRAILDNINSAGSSIDFALYGIDRQNEIFKALQNAKLRGVKIRAVVDSKPDGTFVYSDTLSLKNEFGAVSDHSAPPMHNKFFIFDNSKVLTGTMNISSTGSGGYNANTTVLLEDKRIAEIYLKEFEQMYLGKFQGLKEDFSAKIPLAAPGEEVLIFFSPVGNPYENGLLPLIKNARKEIYISIFYLTHKGIIEELILARQRGVDVKIIYDAVGANGMKEKVKLLRGAGISLKVENWGGKEHEKNMLVDSTYFVTGSANFSNSGMKKNDENILIFKSPAIAGFYREYFLKLYNGLDEKYLKFTPRAESFESGNSCYDGVDNNFDGKVDSEDIGCFKK